VSDIASRNTAAVIYAPLLSLPLLQPERDTTGSPAGGRSHEPSHHDTAASRQNEDCTDCAAEKYRQPRESTGDAFVSPDLRRFRSRHAEPRHSQPLTIAIWHLAVAASHASHCLLSRIREPIAETASEISTPVFRMQYAAETLRRPVFHCRTPAARCCCPRHTPLISASPPATDFRRMPTHFSRGSRLRRHTA